MSRPDFQAVWQPAPQEEAFGPEIPTWARLELRLDGVLLTCNQPAEAFLSGPALADDAVEGALCGVAEWLVDHLAEVLWESHLPVPKHNSVDGVRSGIPDLRMAAGWWSDLPDAKSRTKVAVWQRRHTLGATSTQLALPSIVFVPERQRIGVFVTQPPTTLNTNVRFHLPQNGLEDWIQRSDLREIITEFVRGVISVAKVSADGRQWGLWLEQRLSEAKQRECSTKERNRLMYGEVVAKQWEELIEPLGPGKDVVEGVLSDVAEIESSEDLSALIGSLELRPASVSSSGRRWKELVATGVATSGRAFEQGYELARKVRRDLGLGSDPIERMDVLLSKIDIDDAETDSRGLFRTACFVREKRATVLVSKDVKGVVPRRVALASGLGRVLFEARGKAWGAAVGENSRWQETRRANAFAAELLAPSSVVAEYADAPEKLAEDYGISLTAARWRIHNVRNPPA